VASPSGLGSPLWSRFSLPLALHSMFISPRSGFLPPDTKLVPSVTEAQRADAGRQVRLLGCISCHGEGLSGKILVDAPRLARLYASNLTQVATEYSDEQLAQGIRQGLRKDGRALWVMPSKTFSRLSETETAAIVEFIRSLPAAGAPTPSLAIGPLGRLGLVRGAFKPEPVNVDDYQRRLPLNAGAEHDAGRHLAATICAHCTVLIWPATPWQAVKPRRILRSSAPTSFQRSQPS
jgi:mono/diheme cytochrome c family protein